MSPGIGGAALAGAGGDGVLGIGDAALTGASGDRFRTRAARLRAAAHGPSVTPRV